jgi:CrcB protein
MRSNRTAVTVVLIGAAGAAGVLARYGLGQISSSIWTTCAVNVAGSLLLGILIHAGRGLSPELRDAVGVGLLGGFTTFSTFSVQAVLEGDGGRPAMAAVYVVTSVVLGLGAAALGYYGARGI